MTDNATTNNSVPNDGTREPQIPMPESAADYQIELDDCELFLPSSFNRHKTVTDVVECDEIIITLDELRPILAEPCVKVPEYLCGMDPFFFDLQYLQTHPTSDAFYRRAQSGELSSVFWQHVGADRTVFAVVIRRNSYCFCTHYISLPTRKPLSEAMKSVQLHGATLETMSRVFPGD